MKKKFTIDTWKECIGLIYDKVPIKKFFFFIDILHIFIGKKKIYIFAPTDYIKFIVGKYYYSIIKTNLIKFIGKNYDIYFNEGIAYIDDSRKLCIKQTIFKEIFFKNFNRDVKLLFNIDENKKFFMYINIKNILDEKKKKKVLSILKSKNIKAVVTNFEYILKNIDMVLSLNLKYKVILFFEKEYDEKFFFFLNKNILKTKNFLECRSIIFFSTSPFSTLKNYFFKII